MITRKERWLWGVFAILLAVLFLTSSTDLLIKEKKTQVYQISVIVGDTADENYMNFLKGIDQAALEYHADVRFVTFNDEESRGQQAGMILREVQDGTQAFVIAPEDETGAADMMTEMQIRVPVVSMFFDYYELGQKLGKAVVERHPVKSPVYMPCRIPKNPVSQTFEDGVKSILEPAGYEIRQSGWNGDTGGEPVIVALDPQSLLNAADLLTDLKAEGCSAAGLYGRGTAVPILNYLGRGVITGVCVTDDFTAGYLSIRTAIEQIQNDTQTENPVLKSAYIEQGELRSAEYEKMLYPIE